VPTYQKEY